MECWARSSSVCAAAERRTSARQKMARLQKVVRKCVPSRPDPLSLRSLVLPPRPPPVSLLPRLRTRHLPRLPRRSKAGFRSTFGALLCPFEMSDQCLLKSSVVVSISIRERGEREKEKNPTTDGVSLEAQRSRVPDRLRLRDPSGEDGRSRSGAADAVVRRRHRHRRRGASLHPSDALLSQLRSSDSCGPDAALSHVLHNAVHEAGREGKDQGRCAARPLYGGPRKVLDSRRTGLFSVRSASFVRFRGLRTAAVG